MRLKIATSISSGFFSISATTSTYTAIAFSGDFFSRSAAFFLRATTLDIGVRVSDGRGRGDVRGRRKRAVKLRLSYGAHKLCLVSRGRGKQALPPNTSALCS